MSIYIELEPPRQQSKIKVWELRVGEPILGAPTGGTGLAFRTCYMRVKINTGTYYLAEGAKDKIPVLVIHSGSEDEPFLSFMDPNYIINDPKPVNIKIQPRLEYTMGG